MTLLLARPGRADGPTASERALAERLFDEGRHLVEQGVLDEGCAKLEASNRIDPAVGTLLNLGDCNEKRDRLASAWANFRAAQSLAMTKGDAARADFAKKRAEAVQPKLATLTIDVAASEPGLVVKRDDVVVEAAAFGVSVPLDAGAHTVEARAPGKRPFSVKVVSVDGVAGAVRVETLAPEGPAPASGSALIPPPPEGPPSRGDRRMRTIGIVGMTAGGVVLGVGGWFVYRALHLWSLAKPHCDATRHCDDYGFTMNHQARQQGDAATVLLTTGLVLAGASALVFLFSGDSREAKRSLADAFR